MVEQGRFDEAFSFSVRKLAGKKKKKTKYVMAIEKAYASLNERDLNEIDFLLKKGSPTSWDRIVNLYENIEERQNIISPILPLRSKDGYTGLFEINDYSDEIVNAMELSAEFHYEDAEENIRLARLGDKRAARRALNALGNIDKYFDIYKDADKLKDEMYELGQEHVGVEITNVGGRFFGDQALDMLYAMNIRELNTFWVKFHRATEDVEFDDYVVIELKDVILGTEREWVHHSSYEKEIEDGFNFIKEKVKVKTNKSDDEKTNNEEEQANKKSEYEVKETKVPKHKKIYADIAEIRREKEGGMIGNMKVFKKGSDYSEFQSPIRANYLFYDEAVRFTGNKKALPEEMCARLDDNILNFPSDIEMINHLALGFREQMIREIEKYDFLYN
jgi:hypothetical protein